jgi:hypothetical protein
MKTASDYRDQASKARELARSAPDAKMREVIVRLAETWDDLAAERERQVRQQEAGPLGA